jgi:hypothetical protein
MTEGDTVASPVEVAIAIVNSTPSGWRVAALKLAQLQVRARDGAKLALLALPFS